MTSATDANAQAVDTASKAWSLAPLLLGVVLLSFAAIFTRLAESELSVSATVFNRYFVATIVLGCWRLVASRRTLIAGDPVRIEAADRWLFLLSSILGTAAVSLWAISLTRTSVANSNLLHNVTPVFAVLGAWVVFGQRFAATYLAGMLLAVAGVALISVADLQGSRDSLTGDALALLSAVFYAFNYLTRETLRRKFSTSQILFWTCLLSSIYTGIAALLSHGQLFAHSWQTWVAVIGLAIACQVLGQGLLVQHLTQFSASFVTLLMLLEPLLTASFAAWIFAERLNALNWFAFALVLGGIYLARNSTGAASAAEQELLDIAEVD